MLCEGLSVPAGGRNIGDVNAVLMGCFQIDVFDTCAPLLTSLKVPASSSGRPMRCIFGMMTSTPSRRAIFFGDIPISTANCRS